MNTDICANRHGGNQQSVSTNTSTSEFGGSEPLGIDYYKSQLEEARERIKLLEKPITERLCALLRERHEIGLKKYGVTLDRNDLKPEQWIQHAIEEQLDAAGYLMRLKDTITELRDAAENLYHELNDIVPEHDCKCIIHGERCRSCTYESARDALHAWEGLK